MLAASQTFGFLLGVSSISILNRSEERSKIVLFTYAVLLFLSFVIVLIVKENLKKMRFSLANDEDKDVSDSSNSLIAK